MQKLSTNTLNIPNYFNNIIFHNIDNNHHNRFPCSGITRSAILLNPTTLVTGGNYFNDELRIWSYSKTLKLLAQIPNAGLLTS